MALSIFVLPAAVLATGAVALLLGHRSVARLRGAPSRWNELARTGVVSRTGVSRTAGPRGRHRRERHAHSLELSS